MDKQWYYCNECNYEFLRPDSTLNNSHCPLCDKPSQPITFQGKQQI